VALVVELLETETLVLLDQELPTKVMAVVLETSHKPTVAVAVVLVR
jgi:hypothetical protein